LSAPRRGEGRGKYIILVETTNTDYLSRRAGHHRDRRGAAAAPWTARAWSAGAPTQWIFRRGSLPDTATCGPANGPGRYLETTALQCGSGPAVMGYGALNPGDCGVGPARARPVPV